MASDKKKARSFFFRKKDVVAQKKSLHELNKERRTIEGKLKDLAELYSLPEEWIERLPANILKDVPVASHREDEGINLFEMRAKIRDEHKEHLESLAKVQSNISVNQIELLLAKIKCVEDNLNDKTKK